MVLRPVVPVHPEEQLGALGEDERRYTAVLQDAASGEVLRVAEMNTEALRHTLGTGEAWLWSQDKAAIWQQGQRSGFQHQVVSVSLGCQGNSLVVRVVAHGPTCHKGTRSCFAGAVLEDGSGVVSRAGPVLLELDDLLAARARSRPEGSYVTAMADSDDERTAKLGGEFAALLRALHVGEEPEVAEQAADLIFHIAVALRARGMSMAAVFERLHTRDR